MTARRWFLCAIAILTLLGYVITRGAARHNDFKYPYNVARHLWKTRHFKVASQPRYPVTFHVLLSPIASLPIEQAAAVWAVLSFAALGALPRALQRLSGVSPRQQWAAWVIVLPCVVDALVLGQSDPLNLLLVTAGLAAAKEGRALAGTGLIGIAGMIKFLPAFFWTTVAARHRHWRVVAGISLCVSGGFGLLAVAVGPREAIGGIVEQYQLIRDHEKPWHLVERRSDLRANNESLPIVLARTFGDLGSETHLPRVSLARWPLAIIWATWGTVLLLLVIAWLASIGPAHRLAPERAWLGMFALTANLMLAATPICWHHYFLWILPAALFLRDRPRLLAVAGTCAWVGTVSQTARGLGCHMLVALVLFAVVAREIRRGESQARENRTGTRQASHVAGAIARCADPSAAS